MCFNDDLECGCSEHTDLLRTVFVNDADAYYCQQMAAKSTTKSPEEKNGNDDKKNKKGLMAFSIVISLILAVCIVANIVYCYKRKVNEKIAGQILEHQVG